MKNNGINISALLTRAIYIIYTFFSVFLLIQCLLYPKINYFNDVLKCFLVALPVGAALLWLCAKFSEKINEKACLIVLLCSCLTVKLSWVLHFSIAPAVDYKTFFDTAVNLSSNFVDKDRYVALFPHIMGYALFLSVFFKIFGVHHLIPPLLNVLLSVISMALLYFICRKISGRRAAVAASILWILFPSQTIYNMFVLSEPLYCTIILAIWSLMIYIEDRFEKLSIKGLILYSVLLGLLIELMNMTRPLGYIMVPAFVIWVIIKGRYTLGKRKSLIKKSIYMLSVIACFLIFSFGVNQYLEIRLGEQPASVPGYNIYVGFNTESNGTWNEADSALLTSYSNLPGWSAGDAQKQMFKDALTRLKKDDIDFSQLILNKFVIFLGDDSGAAYYAKSVLNRYELFSKASNVFYYFLIVISLIGAVVAIIKKSKSPLAVICLFAMGVTIAQMLVEVAVRYHYSVTLVMIILAAVGVGEMNFRRNKQIEEWLGTQFV